MENRYKLMKEKINLKSKEFKEDTAGLKERENNLYKHLKNFYYLTNVPEGIDKKRYKNILFSNWNFGLKPNITYECFNKSSLVDASPILKAFYKKGIESIDRLYEKIIISGPIGLEQILKKIVTRTASEKDLKELENIANEFIQRRFSE